MTVNRSFFMPEFPTKYLKVLIQFCWYQVGTYIIELTIQLPVIKHYHGQTSILQNDLKIDKLFFLLLVSRPNSN